MGKTYILDTNIVIYILNGTLKPEQSNDLLEAAKNPANLSVISKMELLGWEAPTQREENELKNFVDGSNIEKLSDDIVNKTIELRRNNKIKLPDAIIAATAIINGHILLSRNDSDFSKISNLTFINPLVTN